MLTKIQIQNFRCFEDFKAEGFERINLIGGKNNSGKTALLEAILLFNYDLLVVANAREESISDIFNSRAQVKFLKIACQENDKSFSKEFTSPNTVGMGDNISSQIQYIKHKLKIPNFNIAAQFDFINKKKLENELLNSLSFVDNKIDGLRTFGESGLTLFVSTKDEDWKPLSSYGDAVSHLVNYFSFLLNIKASKNRQEFVLLIDEIENGIHYTAHNEFWQKLFALSKELNVQIFATTHSLEMIKAFNSVASEKGSGAYFEMIRSEKTNQIKAIKRDAEQLKYVIENQKPFRGE